MAVVDYFADDAFQDQLVRLLVYDFQVLRDYSTLLSPEDFRPVAGAKNGRARWLLAESALLYYQKYSEPGKQQLRGFVLQHANRLQLPDRQVDEVRKYWTYVRTLEPAPPSSIIDRVVMYKRKRLQMAAMEELSGLIDSEELTDERWAEITQRAVIIPNGHERINVYSPEEAVRRADRRLHARSTIFPRTLIHPLDTMSQTAGPRHLGVVFAPPGRGKSLMLLWLAIAYTIQRRHVAFFSLEDPRAQVEDRLDSIMSRVQLRSLLDKSGILQRRLQRFRRMVRGRFHLFDGADGGLSVANIEQLALQTQKEEGYDLDAVFIDYDDEIVPTIKRDARRFEFADIYRELRQMAARRNWIVWTAAQTQRSTEELKILSGDRLAEDYSKIRKARVAIGMGKGEWGEDSLHLWLAKNNYDRSHIGCNIMADYSRMLIYDEEATRRAERMHANDPDA